MDRRWQALRGLARIVYLELLWGTRIPEGVVYNVLGPVLLLLLLGPIRGSTQYLEILVPGLLAGLCASGAMHGIGAAMSYMRLYGSWRTLQASPISGELYFVGLVVSRILRILGTALLLLLAARLAFAYQLHGSVALTLGLLVLGTLVFGAFGLVISGLASSPQAVSSTINFLFIPMLFVSGVFSDPATPWLKKAALLSPLSYLVQLLRASLGGGEQVAGWPGALAALAGWLIACWAVSLLLLRRRLEEA